MSTAQEPPPPPKNSGWHRFANNVIACQSLVDAYLAAGYGGTRSAAYVSACRLRKKPAVAAYIRFWQQRARDHYQAQSAAHRAALM